MKKIGIVTFHRAFNIGAMLQAFALQKAISAKYESDIVDYRSNYIEHIYGRQKSIERFIKSAAKKILPIKEMKLWSQRKYNYEHFEKEYMKESRQHYNEKTINRVNDLYDGFVAGSDQVWNLKLTDNDWNYYLHFASPEKRFSYAGSFGDVEYSAPERKLAQEYLSSYRKLTVREKNGFDILASLGLDAENASLVCDPVFLLTKEEWIKTLQLSEKENTEDYVLLYIVSEPTYAAEYAIKLAEKYCLKVKYINLLWRISSCPDGMENCNYVGPKEFIKLLLYARFVVTTSFHGMALSTIFNKQFYYELCKNSPSKNDRLVTIAEIFGLKDREILSSELMGDAEIDYDRVNASIKKYSDRSREILFDELEKL